MIKSKLVWKAEIRNVRDLIVWGENPRRITKLDLAKLIERIEERGFHAAIVIDTDNTILSGNQRKIALMKLGVEKVNVLVPNRKLSSEEKEKIALESNLNDGEWDFEKLKLFEMDLLTDIGFDSLDLAHVWKDDLEAEDDDFDEEKELAKIKVATTKPGDLIILGNHKLICGSATDPAVLERLFGEERTSMIYCDPPYNLKINYSAGIGGKKNYGGHVNDNRTDIEYRYFLEESISTALSVTNTDAHFFYWVDETYIGFIQDIYRELDIKNRRVCLWLKNAQNPTPDVAFSKCYEPAVYGTIGKPYIAPDIQTLNEIVNKEMSTGNALLEEVLDRLNIWAIKRLPSAEYTHATSKPPTLHEKAIRRCTKPGDIILDSFLGSGSTLIAAEQLGRRVYGTELEPIFCDLIIRRYEKLTGNKAKVISITNEAA